MNKFKSLLLLCMVFAFAAFPLSNQGFCNGDPVLVEDFADCTTTITGTTQVCASGNATYTLNVMLSTTNATSVSVTVTGTAGTAYGPVTNPGTYAGGTVTVSFTGIPDGTTGLSISAVSSGSGCTTPAAPTTSTATHTSCASGCQLCFTGDATIQDAIPAGPGGEVCGTTPQTFEVGNNLTSNGTVGSAGARTITYNFVTSATLDAGTEIFLGSTFTVAPVASVSCATLVEENTNSFTAAPIKDTQLKITPNPVTNVAQISYNLPEEGRVQVSVFDMKGNRIAVIANGNKDSGMHTVDFDASNLAQGFYYLTVQTANTQVTERMVIVK